MANLLINTRTLQVEHRIPIPNGLLNRTTEPIEYYSRYIDAFDDIPRQSIIKEVIHDLNSRLI